MADKHVKHQQGDSESVSKGMRSSESISGLEKLISLIATEYKPEKIILFGSYASEIKGEGSDIDLIIIKRSNKRFVDRVIELVQLIRSRFGFEYPVEPFVYTPIEFSKAKKMNSLFIRTVLSKGIVLYEKE